MQQRRHQLHTDSHSYVMYEYDETKHWIPPLQQLVKLCAFKKSSVQYLEN